MTRDTGFPDDVVDLIWARDKGSCVRCGRGLHRSDRGMSWAIHHREPRGRGGAGKRRTWVNLPSNGLVLCNVCHEWVEGNRKTAMFDGFLVSALGIRRPADVPVAHVMFGLVILNDHGGWEKAA